MYKKLTFIASLVVLLAFALSSGVKANPSNSQGQNSKDSFSLPDHAQQVTENLFYLGESTDVNGKKVEGYAYVHPASPKKGFHHKPGHDRGNNGNGGNGGDDSTSNCYEFLAKDAKWKVKEDYLVDPTNSQGLSDSFVRSAVADSILEWEDASTGTLDGSIQDIFGNEVSGVVDGADTDSPDDKNEVMFGSIDSEGAIAVTIVWGIFSGPPFNRELVEWDQVYDQEDFAWTEDGNLEPNKMDFTNIAMHELGHAFGLGHPGDTCTEETMYAFADFGETKKITLEAGDITGISELY